MPEPIPLPPIADQPLSVLLLAHNAANEVDHVVDDWVQRLNALNREYEILIVEYGSTDGTAAQIEASAARHPCVRLLKLVQPGGAGDALKLGLAAARWPLLVTATCDQQYDPADLPTLLAEIDKLHLVSGIRRWMPVPLPLRILGGTYRLLVRILFGFAPDPLPSWHGWREQAFRLWNRAVFAVRLRDVNCALRLFRREIFEHLPIQSHGDFVQAEVLAKANFLGCYMSEVPVTYRPRSDLSRGPWRKDFLRIYSHPRFDTPPSEPAADWSGGGGESTLPA